MISGQHVYNPSQSLTFQAIVGCTWHVSYVDGSSASGPCGTDTVTIGSMAVQGQVVELASFVSEDLTSHKEASGILGMAFPSLNEAIPQALTFFDNIRYKLDFPLFAAYLPLDRDGEIDFGFVDTRKFIANGMQWAPVDPTYGTWDVSSEYYSINGEVYAQNRHWGALDTGSALLLMGDDVVSAYYANVRGATSLSGQFRFPCDSPLPSLGLKLGNKWATIPGEFLNYTYVGNGFCFGGLQSVGNSEINIYGGIFFYAYYTVFQNTIDGPSVGFAPLK